MDSKGVVPDVIDTLPQHLITVRYPSAVEVNVGNELTPLSVKDEPTVDWPVEEGQYYTLVMTDPDAPKDYAEVKHWLVMNIPGTDLSKGENLAVYRGSGPPQGTGLHRYIFLVYKQSGRIAHTETAIPFDSIEGRPKFNVRDFAKKYSLGEPFAYNYYLAQYDEYVGQLYAQMAKKYPQMAQKPQ